MAIKEEYFKGDGQNTIFQTTKTYDTGTVNVWVESIKVTDTQELGAGYVMLSEAPQTGADIKITYTIEGTKTPSIAEEFDVKKRLVQLEEAVKVLHQSNIALKEALNNRINVSTFQAWTRLIEKKMGVTLIDDNLGHISQELYSSKP